MLFFTKLRNQNEYLSERGQTTYIIIKNPVEKQYPYPAIIIKIIIPE